MNKLFLALLLIGFIFSNTVFAQNYDVKNTASLNSDIGFSVMNMGSVITKDNEQRYGHDFTKIEPSAGVVVPESEKSNTELQSYPSKRQVIITKTVEGNIDTGATREDMEKYLDKVE